MERQDSKKDGKKDDKCLCPYLRDRTEIIVLGASGDLAKKKTYPALFDLFCNGFLPHDPSLLQIYGFARTNISDEEFRSHIRKTLKGDDELVSSFLSYCSYFPGSYTEIDSFRALADKLQHDEMSFPQGVDNLVDNNRLIYFAIPPNVFVSSATCIRDALVSARGWTRLIVEKPFGHDLKSARLMSSQLGSLFSEDHIYRIDHYLGKEMVQNLIMFRFGNTFLEPLLNSKYVHSVQITFKEDFGTEGRGGYFDNYGIIRDVIQNHLMQVLSILAMEPPIQVVGDDAGNFIRDAKVNVLKAIAPPTLHDVVLGQYIGNTKGDVGYLEDPTVPANSKTPTFAQVVLRVNTPRWCGVPFVVKAGKALNERKAEIRIQFKDAPASTFMFHGQHCVRNELVLRLQPSEAVYFKINVKKPGLSSTPLQSELDLSYTTRYPGTYSPDAYTRLVLEALRGNQATFVRSDELEAAWKIFDPLLTIIDESREPKTPRAASVELHQYLFGSRGPEKSLEAMHRLGITRNEDYSWVTAADAAASK